MSFVMIDQEESGDMPKDESMSSPKSPIGQPKRESVTDTAAESIKPEIDKGS